jgi:hypothetical protein
MTYFIAIGILFSMLYLILQSFLLNNRQADFKLLKVFLSFAGMCYVLIATLIISVIHTPAHQKLFFDFIAGRADITLIELPRYMLDAEGLDTLFCFVLALISGYLVYSKKEVFDFQRFYVTFCAWTIILIMKEFMKTYFPERHADMGDIVNNMIGGVLPGLLLSMKGLWGGPGSGKEKYFRELEEQNKEDGY